VPDANPSFVLVGRAKPTQIVTEGRPLDGSAAGHSQDRGEQGMWGMIARAALACVLLAGVLTAQARAEDTLDKIKQRGSIVVGVKNDYKPWGFVDPSGKIEVRRVTLGIQTATAAEALSGLQEGDMVVVSDRSGLKAGEAVQPKVIQLVEYQSQEDKQ
jgi:hypothetical protein